MDYINSGLLNGISCMISLISFYYLVNDDRILRKLNMFFAITNGILFITKFCQYQYKD